MKSPLQAFKSLLKNYFFAGLATLIPIALTVYILKILIMWADTFFKHFIPSAFYPENIIGRDIPGIGIVITFLLIVLVGILTRLYIGKILISWGDRIFSRIPFGKGVYKALKDFVGMTLQEGGSSFKQVALIEYPRQGTWAIVFVTGEATGEIQDKTGEKVYTTFLPTTPNPTSGYLLMVPEKDLTILDMKVDQAMKIIISAGVVKEEPNNGT